MTRNEMRNLAPGFVRLEEEIITNLVGNNNGQLNVAQCNLLNISVLSSESWLQLNKNKWIKESLFKDLMAVRTKKNLQVSVSKNKKDVENPINNTPFITNLDFYSLKKL